MEIRLRKFRMCYPAYSCAEYLEICAESSAKMLVDKFRKETITAEELERILSNPRWAPDWRDLLKKKFYEFLKKTDTVY